jgi:hypothetical protein
MPQVKQTQVKQTQVKQLNSNVPSYKQKLQFETDFKKSEEREKIKPKQIFDFKKNKPVKKKKY